MFYYKEAELLIYIRPSADLQDLDVCDFEQPGLCDFDTNHTSGSRYCWKLHRLSDTMSGPRYDANGNNNGKFKRLGFVFIYIFCNTTNNMCTN